MKQVRCGSESITQMWNSAVTLSCVPSSMVMHPVVHWHVSLSYPGSFQRFFFLCKCISEALSNNKCDRLSKEFSCLKP